MELRHRSITLGPGEFVGELSLLTTTPRASPAFARQRAPLPCDPPAGVHRAAEPAPGDRAADALSAGTQGAGSDRAPGLDGRGRLGNDLSAGDRRRHARAGGFDFGSVRSANRAARVAEQSLLAGSAPAAGAVADRRSGPGGALLRRPPDHAARWGAIVEATEDAVYLAISLRNVANGIAVLHGWRFQTGWTRVAANSRVSTSSTG